MKPLADTEVPVALMRRPANCSQMGYVSVSYRRSVEVGAMSPDPKAPANIALKQIFSGVDKLKAIGFKKKHIFKMISVHIGRRKSRHTAADISAGLRALAGE